MVAIRRRGPTDPVEVLFKVFFVVMVLGLASAVVVGPTDISEMAAAPAETTSRGDLAVPTPVLTDPCVGTPGSEGCPQPESRAARDATPSKADLHRGPVKDVEMDGDDDDPPEVDEPREKTEELEKERLKWLEKAQKKAEQRDDDDDDHDDDDDDDGDD